MRKSNLTVRVNLRISEENKKALDKSAEKNGRTLGSEANTIFSDYFNNKK